jgi:hypothetical protein
VAQPCHPSFLEGRHHDDQSLRSAQQSQPMVGYSGSCLSSQLFEEAQTVGLWFRPAWHKVRDPTSKNNQHENELVAHANSSYLEVEIRIVVLGQSRQTVHETPSSK